MDTISTHVRGRVSTPYKLRTSKIVRLHKEIIWLLKLATSSLTSFLANIFAHLAPHSSKNQNTKEDISAAELARSARTLQMVAQVKYAQWNQHRTLGLQKKKGGGWTTV